MSLLSKKNKLDTIHLDYDVQVIPIGEFETNLKESITDEITKFIKEHILRVLSDRDYAANCLWYIFSYWMENIHREGVAVVYDPPKDDHSISFNLVQLNLSGRHTRLVSIIINSKNKETFETLVEYLYYKEWDY